MSTLIDRLCNTPEDRKHLQREATITEATELVCQVMAEEGVSEDELSLRTNKKPSYVADVLCDEREITLTDLSDMLWAMGREVKMEAVRKD